MSIAIGDAAPTFELIDTDGAIWSVNADGYAPATVIMFTCNHCPYALAWHDRLMEVARDYAAQGVRFAAINSNDAERYLRDSYEAMQARVAADPWPMPYLHDATQEVARGYDAKTTPHVFVLDAMGRLRYDGAADGDYDDPSAGAAWLRGAIDAVLAGQQPSQTRTKPVGCSIKWK
jgi:peroxiredoxin